MTNNKYYIPDLTFVIFTYNEESRIERVIKNFNKFGKVLIADNKSTDKTVEIAQRYSCNILLREEHFDYVENQKMLNSIYESIDTDWIYWGFADEILDFDTLIEIKKVISLQKYDIINIDRKNYFYGKFCQDAFNSRTNKIFKTNSIDFTDNLIHDFGKTTVSSDKIYMLPNKYFVHHFISNTAESYLNTINRYTEKELERTSKPNLKLVFPIYVFSLLFVKHYFKKKGYKSGFAGLQLLLLTFIYIIVKNMKLYEKTASLSTNYIELINNEIRDEILSGMPDSDQITGESQ